MCGICGISRAKRTSIPNGREFAVNAVRAIESRGKHATGFGWAEGDDPNVWYDKRQGPATKVAHHLQLPKKGIHTLVGHTRHFTLGSPSVYENNHPVVSGSIVAVHNGRVSNHKELVALSGVERDAEVDSFAIAALLASPELDGVHPTDLLELVEGCAAIAWMDANDTGVLHLARLSERPMFVGWTKRGDLIMSSTKSTLELTGRLNKVHIRKITEIKEGTYLRVEAGEITDRRKFKVNRPAVTTPEDVPMIGQASPSGLREPRLFDADDLDWWAAFDKQREIERQQKQDAVVVSRRDGIDWPTLVPRRGWKIDG
jgi:glucosamine 6-phosphate synthetase-like amidotransferase/phosphosugar isomerase protein